MQDQTPQLQANPYEPYEVLGLGVAQTVGELFSDWAEALRLVDTKLFSEVFGYDLDSQS